MSDTREVKNISRMVCRRPSDGEAEEEEEEDNLFRQAGYKGNKQKAQQPPDDSGVRVRLGPGSQEKQQGAQTPELNQHPSRTEHELASCMHLAMRLRWLESTRHVCV